MSEIHIRIGDCVDVMKTLPEGSIARVSCDPPYGISFMSKDWDGKDFVFNHAVWLKEVYRILEPGGKVQAFAATKTYHRLAAAMSSVGFVEIEVEAFGYGSGFPKSHAVGKSIDRMRGLERPVIGQKVGIVSENLGDIIRGVKVRGMFEDGSKSLGAYGTGAKQKNALIPVTGPADEVSAPWEDWGTALKPAWEPIVVGRKPLE